MVSTFLSYKLYTADLAKSISRTLSDAQVKREADYYKENIGKITSVDDFLKDQRLYAYAMKAHGLEDMTYAKAFMRKALESDLTDDQSFVRKLVDTRYLAFAKAFNFTTSGGVESGTVIAQDSTDEAETVGLYSEQRVLKGAAASTEADYYKARIGTLTSVDQLLSDSRLFSYALKSYGLDPDIASTTTIRNVLTSDLSDPNSVANKLGDARYQTLASSFSFLADGSVASGGKAQTDGQLNQTILLNYEATGNGTSPAAAAFKTDYFKNLMADVTSVDDLVNNSALRNYAVTAVGLDPIYMSAAMVRTVLTSDLSDPDSPANASGSYQMLAAAFNFNTDGSLDDGVAAQTATQQQNLTDQYLANYDDATLSAEQSQTDYYKLNMDSIGSVDELLKNTKLYTYVLQAYGLDASEESQSTIKRVLQSDPTDTGSYARGLRDPRYTALAAAFNFGTDGLAQGAQKVQLSTFKLDIVTLYTSTFKNADEAKTLGTPESTYYSETIDTIQTVDDLLKDKRLVSYIVKAYGFEEKDLPSDTLRKVLTSDPFDPKSFVNSTPNTKFRELNWAFNFNTDGTAARAETEQAQDRGDLLRTQDLYIRQTMEETAGSGNEGVRLALYFQRKASSITTGYSILADKALMQVVMTALSLPDSLQQADVDIQVKAITKKMDIADFKDPAKVEKFLARFTALYDLDNPDATAASVPSLILGQQDQTTPLIGMDLLSSIQSMKIRI